MSTSPAPKPAWSNRFRAPTIDELRESLPKPTLAVFDDARARLLGCSGLTESIGWQGVPWRWTVLYTLDGRGGSPAGSPADAASQDASPGSNVLVYLIPDPARLQLCVPLTTEHLSSMPLKRMKKWIRDGLIFARAVGATCWPTWELTSTSQLDDVADLFVRKHKLVSASAPTPVAVGA